MSPIQYVCKLHALNSSTSTSGHWVNWQFTGPFNSVHHNHSSIFSSTKHKFYARKSNWYIMQVNRWTIFWQIPKLFIYEGKNKSSWIYPCSTPLLDFCHEMILLWVMHCVIVQDHLQTYWFLLSFMASMFNVQENDVIIKYQMFYKIQLWHTTCLPKNTSCCVIHRHMPNQLR